MNGGRLSRRRPLWLTVYAVLFVGFLYLPVLLLPLFSLNDSTIVAFPLQGFTLRWYGELGGSPQLITALWNSLTVGAVVSVLATVLGTLGAWAVTRYRLPGKPLAVGFIMLPIVAPLIVLAVAVFMLLVATGIELSLLTVGFGHLIVCLPFAFSVMTSRLESFDASLVRASRDLGEGRVQTLLRVVLPISLPGIVSSLLLTFTISFDEFVLSFFLTASDATLPVYVWSQLRFPERLPVVLALGSLILLGSCLLVGVGEWFRRRRQA
ncbi:MAG TPA: ABC transporter permease [Mesorhizobium sp.]|jgi:spermidine/putrescine transport system permease protein|nr:ABC transporter permease [Mesorhizobium sp.]